MMIVYTSSRDEEVMSDPVASDTADLKAWTVRVDEGQAQAFMDGVVKSATSARVEVMVARADMVFGKDHLRSALYHAKRAVKEGTNASDSLAMETLLYASGERQLSSAIKKMSVDGRTEEVVVAQLSSGTLLAGPTWRVLEDLPENVSLERFLMFGIGKLELETLGVDRGIELVLERVASVDILKK